MRSAHQPTTDEIDEGSDGRPELDALDTPGEETSACGWRES
jgi:hypothetical protein